MSATADGDAYDAGVLAEHRDHIRAAMSDGECLSALAYEAEQAYEGALRKVEKQKAHLRAAEASAKELKKVADQARKAAEKAGV